MACSGIVYVASSEYLKKKNIYKIGFTKQKNQLLGRIKELNCSTPLIELVVKPCLQFEVNCPKTIEEHLHERFKHQQVTETPVSEWFTLSSQDLIDLQQLVEDLAANASTECYCSVRILSRKVRDTHSKIIRNRIKIVQDCDISKWNYSAKIPFKDVCMNFGVDLDGDVRNAFFWNIMLGKKITISDDLLEWCGYSGEYKNKKTGFLKLLKKNAHISWHESVDPIIRKKRYIVVDSMDFESLLMQMRSTKAMELREIYALLKHVSILYAKYEKRFDAVY